MYACQCLHITTITSCWLFLFCYILISAHPNVQKVVLVSSASDMPLRAPEISVPADLDKTITELADWLVLIDQMLKSNIVTVGDVEEINKTVSRMKVGAEGKGLLRQRQPPHLGSHLFILNSEERRFKIFLLCQAGLTPKRKLFFS